MWIHGVYVVFPELRANDEIASGNGDLNPITETIPRNGVGLPPGPCYRRSPRAGWSRRGNVVRAPAAVAFSKGANGQVQVLVRDNNVDQALKALKKKMQREGIFREMKLRRHYEKPSERRAREAAEAVRRARKLERKRLEREGF